jgi:lipid A disaccharide synthetase
MSPLVREELVSQFGEGEQPVGGIGEPECPAPLLRALTREDTDAACEQARDICAACGVAVVFVPELSGSRASGVARWLTPAKALIQLSFRYRTDDHLWFTSSSANSRSQILSTSKEKSSRESSAKSHHVMDLAELA